MVVRALQNHPYRYVAFSIADFAVMRYVKGPDPVETLLKFIPIKEHKCEYLIEAVLNVLENHHILIKDCRRPSYDNASNMSGKYSDLQAKIKEKC